MTRTMLLLLVATLTAAPAWCQEKPLPDVGIEQRLDAQVPLDAEFLDEQGTVVTLADYAGSRPIVLVLGYYGCPRLCSQVLNQLVETLRELDYQAGREFDVLAVSIDPRERPELAAAKKRAYVEAYGRPESAVGWHFLTGAEDSAQRLAQAVGYRYVYDAQRDQYAHAAALIVLTPEGKVARYLFGLDYPPRDLRFALEDASAQRIGSPLGQPLRLLCYGYDPRTGRYTLLVMRLTKLAGGVTVLALLAAWWCLRRPAVKQPAVGQGGNA